MPKDVENKIYYHITHDGIYNTYDAFERDQEIEFGKEDNPFFGFYKKFQKNYNYNDNGVTKTVGAIKYLQLFKEGKITNPDPIYVPKIAVDISQHYLMLSRELIMEEVRLTSEPTAPSRKKCLWVVETKKEAQKWAQKMNRSPRIITFNLTGVTHVADSKFLLGDSESLITTYENATRYWKGELSQEPLMEVLFSGIGKVVKIE